MDEISFHEVAGLTLRDRVKELRYPEGSSHQEKPVEMLPASDQDASWMSSCGGLIGDPGV